MEYETCRTCRYWRPASRIKQQMPTDEERRIATRGQCRRRAPRPSALTSTWMETRADDWCGEYGALPPADGNA